MVQNVPTREKLMERASQAKKESRHVEFKVTIESESSGSLCELIKDIVAIANTGGGIIVFGVNDDGFSCDRFEGFTLDTGELCGRIQKYTGALFSEMEIIDIERSGKTRPALLVGASTTAMVFVKPGTYDTGGGKQKTAFAQGTLYFRHGAKSEHAFQEDLTHWIDRELSRIRKEGLGGIRKVVEAPAGRPVGIVVPHNANSAALTVRIGNDPNAVSVVPSNAEEIWPYRQKELIERVNTLLSGAKINSHDVQCINRSLNVFGGHPEFAYRPHSKMPGQYSERYVRWMIERYNINKISSSRSVRSIK